ncbi:hypothetical protein Saro_2710 [Novosphingobium aromaticivorans DSM 12444]|uniref:VRR-NUC domain-containing protein n=1 Tax=Novosphingobium aromaticivorans (strain ATCC 700278 / DSM 12444 / CCUG 56034 / CIP 105152 / NBRC 16084 / F199) TaxID=279238 RepID=Q2G4S7_NOVAD|nr:hypothetical protein [Novosphingobium aromaticivorans]ABD27146.1 hypothetical protein Saro_2710 [Novosphingobium aromaticivorans DSM 12444]SCY89430.1 hypothetical protein SAMN05660666_03465 [Novosphingobium aromaticivorans]
MTTWADLETRLDADPLFFVQKPDGLKHLSEDERCKTLVKLVHQLAPQAEIAHVKNEGRHNHAKAKTLGVVTGHGDYIVTWPKCGTAFVEMKGYSAAGRPGELSQAQVDWANRKFMMGFPVACFFCPHAAFEWLVSQGMPVIGRIAA